MHLIVRGGHVPQIKWTVAGMSTTIIRGETINFARDSSGPTSLENFILRWKSNLLTSSQILNVETKSFSFKNKIDGDHVSGSTLELVNMREFHVVLYKV